MTGKRSRKSCGPCGAGQVRVVCRRKMAWLPTICMYRRKGFIVPSNRGWLANIRRKYLHALACDEYKQFQHLPNSKDWEIVAKDAERAMDQLDQLNERVRFLESYVQELQD